MLDPLHDRGMHEGDAALSHQRAHVAVAELVSDIPADRLGDDKRSKRRPLKSTRVSKGSWACG